MDSMKGFNEKGFWRSTISYFVRVTRIFILSKFKRFPRLQLSPSLIPFQSGVYLNTTTSKAPQPKFILFS